MSADAKPKGGLSGLHLLVGGVLLVGANYAFTHLMDESVPRAHTSQLQRQALCRAPAC